MAQVALRLGDLVGVVGEGVVDAAAVDVQVLPQVLHGDAELIARVAALKPGEGAVDQEVFAAQREKFRKAMGNDLNTSLGVTALYDALKYPFSSSRETVRNSPLLLLILPELVLRWSTCIQKLHHLCPK